MAIPAHTYTVDDYISESHRLGALLKTDPTHLDTAKLAEDIYDAFPPEYTARNGLARAAQSLSNAIHRVLPAYRSIEPVGPRLAVHTSGWDNLIDHRPRPHGGDELAQEFLWVAWCEYVHSLARFTITATKLEPGKIDLEQAAVDLMAAFPDLEVNGKTVRMLSGGRLGMEGLARALEEYGPGGSGHWIHHPDDDQGDQDQDLGSIWENPWQSPGYEVTPLRVDQSR